MKELSLVNEFEHSVMPAAAGMSGRTPALERTALAAAAAAPSRDAPAADQNSEPVSDQAKDQVPTVPSVSVDFVATMGEEFSQALVEVNQLVRLAVANPRETIPALSRCHDRVEVLRRKAMSMQQLARLAHNRVRQSHEKLALHEVVASVLAERQSEHASSGFVVEPRYKPVDIIVDPGLLVSLISAAMDWACEFGSLLRVSTHMKDWPQHGMLTVVATHGVRAQGEVIEQPSSEESVSWYVLQQIAQTMGVGVEMIHDAKQRRLAINFPRTVVALEGMTIMEMESGFVPANQAGASSFGGVGSNFIAGHTVLLITTDMRLVARVRDVCRGLNLRMEHTSSVDLAERMCELSMPHLIMCEEDLADMRFETLMDDLQRYTPGFPALLLGEGDFGFEMSGWSGSARSRISKRDVESQLPAALTIELSRSI